eukprot:SAG11_NODE_429_length_9534_cov_14.689242_6_plen_134_part_00
MKLYQDNDIYLICSGANMPFFHMPAFITSHSFLKAPHFDDQFWAYRLSAKRWTHAHTKWPKQKGNWKGTLERRNPNTDEWHKGWNELNAKMFQWYNQSPQVCDDFKGCHSPCSVCSCNTAYAYPFVDIINVLL